GKTEGKHCSVCNTVLVAQDVVEATGHEMVTDAEAVAPTCTEAGSTMAQHCKNCDYVVESKVVDATGHTEETVKGTPATCTETGLTDGVVCSVCDEVIVAQEEIAAKGHTEATLKGYKPTCENPGKTDGVYCTVCKATIVAQETIPAKGHVDENQNGICDECKEISCDCIHHLIFKNKFYKVIYKIILPIWKLLGINKTCACGQPHYFFAK
ncbi:MAG: hypothetical protein NC110_00845, partial [Ruminococcus sp.]|nr:hypothetical protein [Ruminococcus sp.]